MIGIVVRVVRMPSPPKRRIMERIVKIVWVTLCFFLSVVMPANAGTDTVDETGTYDWEPVMNAIIWVESGGDANAVSGKSCGAMQITPILVAECNNILKKRKSKKRYTLQDRFSVAKSKEMFLLIQSHFNPTDNVEKAIRSWNGGMRYSVRATQRYYEKVMNRLRKG